jgi:Rrf2 family nitric oxide-sensitive transcriptional repressor
MRLTALTDYAMRLLMYVGQHPDRLCTISEVAQRYGISEAHLMKVTHRLGQGGWVETVRGKGGGMRLAKLPRDIGLGEVARDMESDFAIVECFATSGSCALDGQCRLAGIFEGALADFHRHLDRYTLLDLLPQARTVQPVSGPVRARH